MSQYGVSQTFINKAYHLAQLNDIATGQGILRDIPIPLNAAVYTTASATTASNANGVTLDNSADVASIDFKLPGDYDNTAYVENAIYAGDHLELLVDAIATGVGTLAVSTVTVWRNGQAAAITPTLTAAQSAAQTISTSALTTYSFPLQGLGLQPGDSVTLTLDPTITGTNVVIRGFAVRYRSNLALTNIDAR